MSPNLKHFDLKVSMDQSVLLRQVNVHLFSNYIVRFMVIEVLYFSKTPQKEFKERKLDFFTVKPKNGNAQLKVRSAGQFKSCTLNIILSHEIYTEKNYRSWPSSLSKSSMYIIMCIYIWRERQICKSRALQ